METPGDCDLVTIMLLVLDRWQLARLFIPVLYSVT